MISETLVGEWLDNPIFVKHIRSRLRLYTTAAWCMVVIVLCSCALVAGFMMGRFANGLPFSVIFAMEAILLGVIGAWQVASAVGNARASGILEYHRISLMSSTELVFGFLFGAPIREYLLFAITVPFMFASSLLGVPTFRGLIQMMILLVASGWVLHSASLLSALMTKKASSGRGTVGLVILLCLLIGPMMVASAAALTRLDVDYRIPFFDFGIPWLGFVLLCESSFIFFAILASIRKMKSERMHTLSKPQAMAALLTLSLLLLGGMWNQIETKLACFILVYALTIASIVMTWVVTPDRAEYIKGCLRALKQGRNNLAWWHDFSWNRNFLLLACLVVFVGSSICLRWSDTPADFRIPDFQNRSMHLSIASGVLFVAYMGLAFQFFLLRIGKYGVMAYGLFLFLAVGLPLIAGMGALSTGPPTGTYPGLLLLAMSPMVGLGLSAGMTPNPELDATMITQIQFASLCPTLLYTFVFAWLVVSARRRVDRQARESFKFETEKELQHEEAMLV